MLTVGAKFSSYEDLMRAVEEFEFENQVKFTKLHTAKLHDCCGPEKLIYKCISFICVKGGPFRSRGKGLRITKSDKGDCTAHINVRLSKDGHSLEIKSLLNEHNHELSKRWIYFKDGITKSIRRRLNLKKQYIRNSICQTDGHENLLAALVDPQALEILAQPMRKQRKVVTKAEENQESVKALESICFSEVSTVKNVTPSPIKTNKSAVVDNSSVPDKFPVDSTFHASDYHMQENPVENRNSGNSNYLLLQTQKQILNTLNTMNANIQTLNNNLISMSSSISTLAEAVGNITHIVLRKPPQH